MDDRLTMLVSITKSELRNALQGVKRSPHLIMSDAGKDIGLIGIGWMP